MLVILGVPVNLAVFALFALLAAWQRTRVASYLWPLAQVALFLAVAGIAS